MAGWMVRLVLVSSVAVAGLRAQGTQAPAGAALGVLKPLDVFELEYASDPQVAPDGSSVVYVRHAMDIMRDQRVTELWVVRRDGGEERALTSGPGNPHEPRWSPDGGRLAYISSKGGSPQIWLRWMDSGQETVLTHVHQSPSGLAWSPDGHSLAFMMRVAKPSKPLLQLPLKPKGAKWAAPPMVIQDVLYRRDGQGYLKGGFPQLFVLPATGGTPRVLTHGAWPKGGPPVWNPDGKSLYLSATPSADWAFLGRNTEVMEVRLDGGAARPLTKRLGPDEQPAVSPDGRLIAYVGFDDHDLGYQVRKLYVMNREGGEVRLLSGRLDRSVSRPVWSRDGTRIFFQYDDQGHTVVGSLNLKGELQNLVRDLGGTSLGRPYSGGSFSLSWNGLLAYTRTDPSAPADVALWDPAREKEERLTHLNRDLLGARQLASVEELDFRSSFDGRRIQGWLMKPSGFNPKQRYPLILEIHGGPFANYGARFSVEMQLYAAAGYVVLYLNPRGSTGYGEAFADLIHHHYPGEDYDDLMSGVDAALARGFIDPKRLLVTGGSGGGVLSAWIVGKTGRFRAAVVAKPVIDWSSFALTSDFYPSFVRYWFTAPPWEKPLEYWRRSPLSLVGHITTPTMLLSGEEDHRTPPSEAEQFYQALKLRQIPAALVRIPGASHHISARPSQLMTKVACVLAWFARHGS